VWFTDPPFGILTNYEGHKAPSELPTNVYRVSRDGRATVVTGDVPRPNGLAFSPDESRLYVVASGDSPRTIRVFDVARQRHGAGQRARLRELRAGRARRLPVRHRRQPLVRVGGGEGHDGVVVFSPTARWCFESSCGALRETSASAGRAATALFMAASQSIYSVYVDAQGATLS